MRGEDRDILPTSYTGLKSWQPGRERITIKAGSKHLLTRVSGRFGRADGNPSSTGDHRMAADVILCLHPWDSMAIPLPSSASSKLMNKPGNQMHIILLVRS